MANEPAQTCVRTRVLAALIEMAREERLNRQVGAVDVEVDPPEFWDDDESGAPLRWSLPTDDAQQSGAAELHKLTVMIPDHLAFDETRPSHCRVQAVIQLVGRRPLVAQLDVPHIAWEIVELDANRHRETSSDGHRGVGL